MPPFLLHPSCGPKIIHPLLVKEALRSLESILEDKRVHFKKVLGLKAKVRGDETVSRIDEFMFAHLPGWIELEIDK